MRKIRYLLFACIGGMFTLMSFSLHAHAETHITASRIGDNEYWSASNSPYIMDEQVAIRPWQTLTIGPGVVIVGGTEMDGYDYFDVQGRLLLNGKPDNRIKISGNGGIRMSSGTTTALYVDIDQSYGLSVYYGGLNISSSTISNANIGIMSISGLVDIVDSSIYKNGTGIFVAKPPLPVYQVKGDGPGIGGEGNAFDGEILAMNTPPPSVIKVTNSVIADNAIAIQNNDSKSVDAAHNWWGTDAGPMTIGNNRVSGLVDYAPWLSENPFVEQKKSNCCSSILFIPGLEGSSLYLDSSWPILGTTTNTLWVPNRNADVQKLNLDANGSSINKGVYSGDPIDKVSLGIGSVSWKFLSVYDQFMNYLNGLAGRGTINEWKAFGYDWRKPIAEVVAGSEKKATTTESLIKTVTDLATRSKTGKVTLIAHSNGGLVAKYLVKTLTDIGKASLIDSVISVAVPYLGTPAAIPALLHGNGQSIAVGLVLEDSTARDMGINMSSAYSLLPSKEYFQKVLGPTIAFAATTTGMINDGSYPKSLDTFDRQSSFIADKNNVRKAPASIDTYLPIKGNQLLMNTAYALHGILDPFSWPASIARYAIVGWGLKTVESVLYSENKDCIHGTVSLDCNTKIPILNVNSNSMGDGTVVSPSASYNSGTVAAVNLPSVSDKEGGNINHVNILEASSTRSAIDAIVTRNPANEDSVVIEKLKQIPGISIGEPDFSKGKASYLELVIHSPVELHVYDSKGNHTGLIPKPAGLEGVEDGLYTFMEEKIPNSLFSMRGSRNGDKDYVIDLDDNNSEKYSVVLNGTGVGEFSFDVSRIEKGVVVDKIKYAYMPVTPLTVATTTITAKLSDSTRASPFASTSPILSIDVDGNGKTDIRTSPKADFDPIVYLESVKSTVATLAGSLPRGANIIKRIDKIENLIKSGKYKQANRSMDILDKRVSHIKFKKLTDKDKQQILDMLDQFVAMYE